MSTTPTYTEASVDEALLILGNTMATMSNAFATGQPIADSTIYAAIDMAAQKLRGVQLSPEDAEALELARKHPIDLPWMQPEQINAIRQTEGYPPIVVIASESPAPMCSPLSCDGCPACEKGGEGA